MSNISARELVIFTAKKIITMDDTLPEATAVAVSEGKVLAVGTLEDMAVWTQDRQVRIDRSFEDQVLMPGLIDNHIHPFLGILTQLATDAQTIVRMDHQATHRI